MSLEYSDAPEVTLIVPCYNEVTNVPVFYETARECYAREHIPLEIVFVDDGSTDNTIDSLREVFERSEADGVAVQVIRFSRNFGKESGMYAGLQAARGTFECIIDADMQQDPALTIEMYNYLKEHPDCDVVAAYQEKRNDSWFRRKASSTFYKMFNRSTGGVSIPENASDFRMFRREVGDALLSMPEYYRFSKAMFAWVGFNTHTMPYTPNERHSGSTKWSVWQLYRYAKDGLMSFATWPLDLARVIGGVFFIGAFLYLLYVIIVDYLIMGIAIPGYPTIVCLILLLGGAQLFVLGVIGAYLGRDYIQNKNRPIYIAKEHLGAEDKPAARRQAFRVYEELPPDRNSKIEYEVLAASLPTVQAGDERSESSEAQQKLTIPEVPQTPAIPEVPEIASDSPASLTASITQPFEKLNPPIPKV